MDQRGKERVARNEAVYRELNAAMNVKAGRKCTPQRRSKMHPSAPVENAPLEGLRPLAPLGPTGLAALPAADPQGVHFRPALRGAFSTGLDIHRRVQFAVDSFIASDTLFPTLVHLKPERRGGEGWPSA